MDKAKSEGQEQSKKEKDHETSARVKQKVWLKIVMTLLLGICIPILIAWLQIYRTGRQKALAEAERTKNVRDKLVAIVEEHVINKKQMDVVILARLVDIQSKIEDLKSNISVQSLVQQAEYNILSSRYLEFQKKEEYTAVFDEFYRAMAINDFATYEDVPHFQLLNQVAKNIQDGDTKEALQALNGFVEQYRMDIAELKKINEAEKSWSSIILRSPVVIISVGVYLILVTGLFQFMRMRRRIIYKRYLRDKED